MENSGCQPTAKKTLMNAVERLNATADRFDELSELSEKLVAKFARTEAMSCRPGLTEDEECRIPLPDIIDLFIGINNRLDKLLHKIGSNVESVVNMID